MNKKLTDPVAEGVEAEVEGDVQGVVDDITFHQVPETAARQTHPFDGYPLRKVQVGTYIDKGKEKPLMAYLSSLVILTPSTYVHQDPSGFNVSHVDPKTKEETFQDLATFHSRLVIDSRGRNMDVVFDRTIVLQSGKTFERVAIVDDHVARSQLIYTVDPRTGQVGVDRRYGLFDLDQKGRLLKVFRGFRYQQTASERMAERHYQEAGAEG